MRELRVHKVNVCGNILILGFEAQLTGIHQFLPMRDSWLVAKCVFNTYIQLVLNGEPYGELAWSSVNGSVDLFLNDFLFRLR